MIVAIAYARVSSREQEREGYSIPAQRKLISEYARTRGFSTKHEFIDIESAKNPGRKEFTKMIRLLETDDACRVVLVEKTDRLYRNRADALAFEALIEKRCVEIHLIKEGRVISKESRSQDKFMHDIHVAVAKHYVENLKEEVKKGMREKAEEGIYPGRAPIGYRNNPATRTIDVDPERAPMVKRVFELYATGEHSLITLRKTVLSELGLRLARSYFETILKNRFYLGYFIWQGVEYKGTHEPLISSQLFDQVQDVFAGRNKPKHRKHAFAFAGLLKCAHDGCTVTAEKQKGKYVYYRCSHGRGKCSLPYMREQEVSDRMADVLNDIYVPEEVTDKIIASLDSDRSRVESERENRRDRTQQRLSALRTRMDQMYEDKLDGKIDEEFWSRKMNEWCELERTLESELSRLKVGITDESMFTVREILELANQARSLYVTRNHAERAQLLKHVLLNCDTDGISLWPSYKYPYNLISERAKNQEWSGREDLNLRPPAMKIGSFYAACCWGVSVTT
jgi:site-specific DNA recombinase